MSPSRLSVLFVNGENGKAEDGYTVQAGPFSGGSFRESNVVGSEYQEL